MAFDHVTQEATVHQREANQAQQWKAVGLSLMRAMLDPSETNIYKQKKCNLRLVDVAVGKSTKSAYPFNMYVLRKYKYVCMYRALRPGDRFEQKRFITIQDFVRPQDILYQRLHKNVCMYRHFNRLGFLFRFHSYNGTVCVTLT